MIATPDQIAADFLLMELASRGIRAEVHGANIRLRPSDKVTPELLARLRKYKADVIGALRLPRLDEDLLYEWRERVAICIEDGGLDQSAAEAIAWRQIDAAQAAHVGQRGANVAVAEGRTEA
jgi:hypothetical protein